MPTPGHTLWLLRHAKTVTDPPPGGADFDRKLAPRGRRDAKALGHLIGRHGAGLGVPDLAFPEIALVSPAARTAATAELALGEIDAPPTVHLVADLYAAEPEDVMNRLRTLDESVASVMVIGHNPTMHALSRGLISKADKAGQDLALRRGFPTCALGLYVFDVPTWSEVGAKTATLAGLFIPPFGED